MAYPTLNVDGTDFTVTKWNNIVAMLERLGVSVLGPCIISGLAVAAATGFEVSISNGVMSSRSAVSLTSIANHTCPPSTSVWLWIDDDGDTNHTATYVAPDANSVCLGKVTTDGSGVTAVSLDGRMDLLSLPSVAAQVSGYASVAVTVSNVTLTAAQYGKRIIEFTGVLTGNRDVIVPLTAGYEWTFIDSTTGAFAITVKGATGTGIVLAHTKSAKLFTDGTNVRRVTLDA